MLLKSTFLFFVSLFICNLAFAQTERFYLSLTEPQNYETGVGLETTISFTFSEPVDVTQSYAADLPVGILYAGPEDSLTLRNHRFNDDRTVFSVDAVHTPDTKFTWIVTAARSESGKALNPITLNYSTSSEYGTTVIVGDVRIFIPVKLVSGSDSTNYSAGAFALSGIRPTPGTESNYPEELYYSGSFGRWGGYAEIKNVKPGTYWPVAFTEWTVNGNFSFEEYDGFGYYDTQFNMEPDSIVVEAGTDTLDVAIDYVMGTNLESDYQSRPGSFTLLQNYPNPFNPSTTIRFQLNTPGHVSLGIFDLTGRKIQEVYSDKFFNIGLHSVDFDGSKLSTGMYFYRLRTSSGTQTLQMILLK